MTGNGATARQLSAAGRPLNDNSGLPEPFRISGLDAEPLTEAELRLYGVDHQDLEDPQLLQRMSDALDAEGEVEGATPHRNPFATHLEPRRHPHVALDPPIGPLTPQQMQMLDQYLEDRHDLTSRDMSVRKVVWEDALTFCEHMFEI
jgi:hypothetical protein